MLEIAGLSSEAGNDSEVEGSEAGNGSDVEGSEAGGGSEVEGSEAGDGSEVEGSEAGNGSDVAGDSSEKEEVRVSRVGGRRARVSRVGGRRALRSMLVSAISAPPSSAPSSTLRVGWTRADILVPLTPGGDEFTPDGDFTPGGNELEGLPLMMLATLELPVASCATLPFELRWLLLTEALKEVVRAASSSSSRETQTSWTSAADMPSRLTPTWCTRRLA